MDNCRPIEKFLSENPSIFEVDSTHKFKLPISAYELDNMDFPPLNWLIEDLLTEGLYVLSGKPKSGKSWWALNIAYSIALGGKALSSFDCHKADVVYIAYEDNKRRLQNRQKKILHKEWIESAPKNFFFYAMDDFPKLNDGGIDQLKFLLNIYPNIKLIVVDTLARGSKQIKSKNNNTYLDEYDYMAEFQNFAINYGVCLLVVHHSRKQKSDDPFDNISGSVGVQAGADGLLVLEKENNRVLLHCTGKDIEEKTFEMEFKDGNWKVVEEIKFRANSIEQRELVDCFNNNYELILRTSEIAAKVGKKDDNVSHLIKKLVQDGYLEKVKNGCYKLRQK
jgi:RecA-family ATPase